MEPETRSDCLSVCMGTSCFTRKHFNAASKYIHIALFWKIQMQQNNYFAFFNKKKELVTPIIECGVLD